MNKLVLAILIGFAQTVMAGVSIHSIQVPGNASDKIPVTIEYSYDGSDGPTLPVGAYVSKGLDGEITSHSYTPSHLLTGSHLTATVVVTRPLVAGPIRTDRVLVLAHVPQTFTMWRKAFEQPVEWAPTSTLSSYERFLVNQPTYAFDARDFEEVEKVFDYWMTTSRFSVDGYWKIDDLPKSMLIRFKHDRAETLSKIRDWRAKLPKGRGGALMEAWYWVHYANHLRPTKRGIKPDADTMKVVRQYHDKARKILAESKAYAASVPLWYRLHLQMAIDSSSPEGVIRTAFNEGVRAFPHYQGFYDEMTKHLLTEPAKPNWAEFKGMATDMDERIGKEFPQAYANLMDYAAEISANTVLDLFSTRVIGWPKVRESWKALLAQYPTAHNWNRYAAMACQAHDGDAFGIALSSIGSRFAPGAWPGNLTMDTCRVRFLKAS